MSSSAICEGPSAPIETPTWDPTELQVGVGDRRHADEVVGAAEEGAEGRGERLPAARLHADRGGDHLLLGDVHLEEAVGDALREALGVGRVADLGVEGDDVLVDRAEPGQRVAVGAAGRDLLAELVARPLDRCSLDLERLRRRRRLHLTLSERIPPSSSTAASGSASGLPCWFALSSTAATPRPFLVRAKITAGRSASCGARRRRRSPHVVAVDLLHVPAAGARPSRAASRCPSRAWSARAARWLTSTIAIRLASLAWPACAKASHIEPSQLGVAAEHPDPKIGGARGARRRGRCRRAIGRPWPSEPVATSTQGSSGVGWPCRREPNSRKVSSSSSSIAPAALRARRAAARRGPWRRRGGRCAVFSGRAKS